MTAGMKTIAALGAALALASAAGAAQAPPAQPNAPVAGSPPPSSGGIFPLSEVHRGMTATAWTVFSGTKPEPMGVEILGVLRNARGPHQDLILARLTGSKPEYTGVVEGMSGSPVYIGKRLLGSLSYRIGQFSKEPIAGITPIEEMLAVSRMSNVPRTVATSERPATQGARNDEIASAGMMFKPMDTPLVMAGFEPAAVAFWQQKMAGTGLTQIAAGGVGGTSEDGMRISPAAEATLQPGSAISAMLVRGDLEVSATCTVTYIDAKHLLACGHPIFQLGQVSLPMTTADVVATLASPLNAFKIINTGATVGAFTEDRDSAVGGLLGAQARMIPVHVTVHDATGLRHVNVEILDEPSLTPQAMMVVVYDALLQNNGSSAETSFHLTGNIDVDGFPPSPLNLWSSAGGAIPATMETALRAGQQFAEIYSNSSRMGTIRNVDLQVEAIPRYAKVQLESARLISSDLVHAGQTVVVEATVRPWREPARNVRIPITIPARLNTGTVRVLVSDAGTLDRTLNQPTLPNPAPSLSAVLAENRRMHAEDRIYVSLLIPEAQAGLDGQTLTELPLSVANAMEPVRDGKQVVMNGESADVVGQAPAGGLLAGFQILSLHIEPGSSLN
ncbi:MAG TPA: SpoIVB peptidase S55 [Terracidiphilus sp.]